MPEPNERTERTYRGLAERDAGVAAMRAEGWRVFDEVETKPRAIPGLLGLRAEYVITFARENGSAPS